jgi:hypothetical protein
MADNPIRGLPDVPDFKQDAVNQKYVDDNVDAAKAELNTSIDVNAEDIAKIEIGVDGKVSKSGDVMVGNLTTPKVFTKQIQLTDSRTINAENGTAGTLAYNGAPKLKFGANVMLETTFVAQDNRITGLPEPTIGDEAATKNYVDTNDISPEDLAGKLNKSGDTMTGTLTLKSPTRVIDADTGAPGTLSYSGTKRFTWGATNHSFSPLDMNGNKITDVPLPLANTEAANKQYVDSNNEKDVTKTGDTMSGTLNIDVSANEALIVKKSGETGFTVWADGSVDAKGMKVDQQSGDDQSVVPKSYVDSAITASVFDGGTIHKTLLLDSLERDINVTSGEPGHLKYDGVTKFRWGTGKNFSDQQISMGSNKIIDMANPSDEGDAVNKAFLDIKLQSRNLADNNLPETIISGSTYKTVMEWKGYDGTGEGSRKVKAWVKADGAFHSAYTGELSDTHLITKANLDTAIGTHDDFVSKTSSAAQVMQSSLKIDNYGYVEQNSSQANGLLNKSGIESMINDIPGVQPAVEIGTSASPPSARDKGSMYLTTTGKLYIYTA